MKAASTAKKWVISLRSARKTEIVADPTAEIEGAGTDTTGEEMIAAVIVIDMTEMTGTFIPIILGVTETEIIGTRIEIERGIVMIEVSVTTTDTTEIVTDTKSADIGQDHTRTQDHLRKAVVVATERTRRTGRNAQEAERLIDDWFESQ